MALSSDGKTVVTGAVDGFAQLWKSESGAESARIDGAQGPVLAVALSPDGQQILTGTQFRIARLWEVRTRSPVGAPMHHHADISLLAFHPGGKAAVTATIDGTIRIWELATGLRPHRTWKPGGAVRTLAFRPDGQTLLAGYGDNLARVFDASTGAPLSPPLNHSSNVESVAFRPDGKVAMTAGWSMEPKGDTFTLKGQVYRWDAYTGADLGRLLDAAEMVRSVAFLPDGRSVLVASSANLTTAFSFRPYDSDTAAPVGKAVKLGSERIEHAVLSPDGRRVLTASHLGMTAQLWDLATGQPLSPPIKHPDWVMAVAFRPDGQMFATGCKDRTARVWNAATGQPLGQPMENGQPVAALAFSPDGRTLLTGCEDFLFAAGEARLWDVATGQPIAPPLAHAHGVTAVAFRPDGKAIATGDAALSLRGPGDGSISIWMLPAPESGEIEEIRRRILIWTGLKLQDSDRFETLEPEAWQELRRQIEAQRSPDEQAEGGARQ
jgi:WD40 repeat protein